MYLLYNIHMSNSGMDQIAKPFVDTAMFLPNKAKEAVKDVATGVPRNIFKGIMNIGSFAVRLPLMALMNIPFLPNGANIGKINYDTRMKYREILQGAGRY
jgi:hypothetical protein